MAHAPAENGEQQYYELLETLPLVVYSVEASAPYRPIYVSSGIEALGYTRDEWLAVPDRWIQSIHEDDRERVLRASEAAREGGKPLEYEYRMHAADGSVRWIHDRGNFVLDGYGKAVHWQGVMVDVTDRKTAQLALQESEERFRRMHDSLNGALALLEATIESTTDGLLVVDRQSRIIRMNRRFIELWRIPEQVLAARDDDQAIAFVLDQLQQPDEFLEKVRELYANPEAESLDTLLFKDGRVYERASRPQRIDGLVVGRVWSFRDISGRLALEEQVRQSQKMDAIGSLAGGVAHDFNNILTVIRGHVELLLSEGSVAGRDRADLESVNAAAERAMMLTRQLLTFSRKEVVRPVVLDLGKVVSELQPMLRRLIREDVAFVTTLASDALMKGDRAQLEQVLLNFVVNSRDAMPAGGTISITVDHFESNSTLRTYGGDMLPPGRFVRVDVRDTGEGIPAGVYDRIFEPFFTTKARGHGTGLGLATVYGIVKQANGFIAVDSAPGAGTTFSLFFPVALERRVVPRSPSTQPTERGSGRILIVEDEDAVRHFVQRALSDRGYTTLVASSGREALQIARTEAGAIDLVLTDVIMPEMSGTQLAAELRVLHIQAPVLFMTGYSEDEMIHRGLSDGHIQLLQKPFTTAELTAAIRGAIR